MSLIAWKWVDFYDEYPFNILNFLIRINYVVFLSRQLKNDEFPACVLFNLATPGASRPSVVDVINVRYCIHNEASCYAILAEGILSNC